MAYYSAVDAGPPAELSNFEPSGGMSLRNAVASTFAENPTTLIWDAGRLRQANAVDLPRIGNDEAQRRIDGAGVKIKLPEGGYTSEALDILIARQQDAAARQSISDRTPWGFGSLLRGSAQLLTGVVDPLNIASAFIPVVREQRAAQMLARAGESAFARAGVRAQIGAVEGLAGAALLEPAVYGLHQQLQDDYGMADSLVNLAFGTVLGGGLHAGAGVVRDWAAGPVRQAVQALDLPPDAPPALAAQRMVLETDLASVGAAPFARRAALSETEARTAAFEAAKEGWRAELLAETSGRASAGDVPALRSQLAQAGRDLAQLSGEPELKRRAAEFQQQGMSRKEAEAAARRSVAADVADRQASAQRAQGQIDANTRASRAEQQLAALEAGTVPERFARDLEDRTASMLAANAIVRAIEDAPETPARFVVGMASPVEREAAMRSALASAAMGRVPDVDAIVRGGSVEQIAAAARRQQQPDSLAVGSPEAARAATERLDAAPKDESAESAQQLLDEAEEQLQATLKNLELGGLPPERLARITEALKPFDDAMADAKKLGQAITQYALCALRQ